MATAGIIAGMGQFAEQERRRAIDQDEKQRAGIRKNLQWAVDNLSRTPIAPMAMQLLGQLDSMKAGKLASQDNSFQKAYAAWLHQLTETRNQEADSQTKATNQEAQQKLGIKRPITAPVAPTPPPVGGEQGAPIGGAPPPQPLVGQPPQSIAPVNTPFPEGFGREDFQPGAFGTQNFREMEVAINQAEQIAIRQGLIQRRFSTQEREALRREIRSMPEFGALSDTAKMEALLGAKNLGRESPDQRRLMPKRIEAEVAGKRTFVLERFDPSTGQVSYANMSGKPIDPSTIKPIPRAESQAAFAQAKQAREAELGRSLTAQEIVDMQRQMSTGPFIPLVTELGVVSGAWNPKQGTFSPPPSGVTARKTPLSEPAKENLSNARSGMKAIAKLRNFIEKDPWIIVKASIPGSLGAREYTALIKEASDVITRLRTGAALNASEEAFYKSQMPTLLDLTEPTAIEAKLAMIEAVFQGIIDPSSQNPPALTPPPTGESATGREAPERLPADFFEKQ